MNHRQRHAAACRALFADFQPDFSGCRDPVEAQTILRLASEGQYSYEIAQVIGKTPKAVQKFFRRYQFPTLQNLAPPLREERIGWAGGVKIVKGYSYSRTPGHPHSSKHGGYVAVHRLVMEKKLGRYLLPTEVVDHIDGDPSNNHPDNLRVFASNSDHLRETLKGRVPAWTDEGKAALDRSRRRVRRKAEDRGNKPNRVESETDAHQ